MNCRPRYVPGKFLKSRWNQWNAGGASSYGQVSDAPSSRNGNRSNNTAYQGAAEISTGGEVRRETSVRSVITLPAYSPSPKPSEQVIAREGERGGMDIVVEFPETAEEEENRREELMESLYQVREQRRREIAEREARRQERREARARGDYIRLEQLRQQSRARARSRSATNGSSNSNLAHVEHQTRGRDQRIASVSYAELGRVRHDGSRLRATSPDSDRRPLLTSDGPDQRSTSSLTNVHSRGESYSSIGSDTDSLTHVQSQAISMHSGDPATAAPEEGDVGARSIPPPPDYDHLDWGEAPPYQSPIADRGEGPPQLPRLTPLPTIQVDAASPVSNTPATPTVPSQSHRNEPDPAEHSNKTHPTN